MTVQFIQKSIGGTLSYWVANPIDSACTPTVTLYDETGGVILASQTATQGPATTLDDSATAGASSIPLAATTSLSAGETYYLGPNSSGQWEYVTVTTIVAGASVSTRHPLLYSYASADKFRSQKLSVSISSSDLTSVNKNAMAKWVYTSDSLTEEEYSSFHVSIYCPQLKVTEQDILRRFPSARTKIASGMPLSELISDVFENDVLGDLSELFDPTGLISGRQLRSATIHRVIAQLHYANGKLEMFDAAMQLYAADLDRVCSAGIIDEDSDGDTTDEPLKNPMFFRIVQS